MQIKDFLCSPRVSCVGKELSHALNTRAWVRQLSPLWSLVLLMSWHQLLLPAPPSQVSVTSSTLALSAKIGILTHLQPGPDRATVTQQSKEREFCLTFSYIIAIIRNTARSSRGRGKFYECLPQFSCWIRTAGWGPLSDRPGVDWSSGSVTWV